jgi:hypothetical protein
MSKYPKKYRVDPKYFIDDAALLAAKKMGNSERNDIYFSFAKTKDGFLGGLYMFYMSSGYIFNSWDYFGRDGLAEAMRADWKNYHNEKKLGPLKSVIIEVNSIEASKNSPKARKKLEEYAKLGAVVPDQSSLFQYYQPMETKTAVTSIPMDLVLLPIKRIGSISHDELELAVTDIYENIYKMFDGFVGNDRLFRDLLEKVTSTIPSMGVGLKKLGDVLES